MLHNCENTAVATYNMIQNCVNTAVATYNMLHNWKYCCSYL